MILKAEELVIVPYTDQYLEDYYREFTGEITRYQFAEPFGSPEAAGEYLDAQCGQMGQGDMLLLVILSDADEFLGSAEVYGLKETFPEIGIWLKRAAQGRGYAFRALTCLMQYLNDVYHKEAYLYEADIRNGASLRLAKKFRYQDCGVETHHMESGKELFLQTFRIQVP